MKYPQRLFSLRSVRLSWATVLGGLQVSNFCLRRGAIAGGDLQGTEDLQGCRSDLPEGFILGEGCGVEALSMAWR